MQPSSGTRYRLAPDTLSLLALPIMQQLSSRDSVAGEVARGKAYRSRLLLFGKCCRYLLIPQGLHGEKVKGHTVKIHIRAYTRTGWHAHPSPSLSSCLVFCALFGTLWTQMILCFV